MTLWNHFPALRKRLWLCRSRTARSFHQVILSTIWGDSDQIISFHNSSLKGWVSKKQFCPTKFEICRFVIELVTKWQVTVTVIMKSFLQHWGRAILLYLTLFVEDVSVGYATFITFGGSGGDDIATIIHLIGSHWKWQGHSWREKRKYEQKIQQIHLLWKYGLSWKTLPKAQRTRGLSSPCQSNFLKSYHKFKHKSWSNFIFKISTKHLLQDLN